MGLVDRLRKLPTPLLFLHIFSKAVVGFGLGIVLAKQLSDWGGWLILLGLALSVLPAYKILSGKE